MKKTKHTRNELELYRISKTLVQRKGKFKIKKFLPEISSHTEMAYNLPGLVKDILESKFQKLTLNGLKSVAIEMNRDFDYNGFAKTVKAEKIAEKENIQPEQICSLKTLLHEEIIRRTDGGKVSPEESD